MLPDFEDCSTKGVMDVDHSRSDRVIGIGYAILLGQLVVSSGRLGALQIPRM